MQNMGKSAFDFSDVIADLEKKIDNHMRDETTKEMISRIFAETTQKEVYDAYTPAGKPKYDDFPFRVVIILW